MKTPTASFVQQLRAAPLMPMPSVLPGERSSVPVVPSALPAEKPLAAAANRPAAWLLIKTLVYVRARFDNSQGGTIFKPTRLVR